MKRILVILYFFLYYATSDAQVNYSVTVEPGGTRILNGIISRDILKADSTFQWMRNNISWYKPNAEAVKQLEAKKNRLYLIVFGGTWCEDTHNIWPQLFKLLDEAAFPDERLVLIGTDRNKKTSTHIGDALGVINVPTIIVMQDGKEVGRVTEYGKYGQYDKELAEILAKAGQP